MIKALRKIGAELDGTRRAGCRAKDSCRAYECPRFATLRVTGGGGNHLGTSMICQCHSSQWEPFRAWSLSVRVAEYPYGTLVFTRRLRTEPRSTAPTHTLWSPSRELACRSCFEVAVMFQGRRHVLRLWSSYVDGRWRKFSFVTC
jgi:hypothetical protein